MATKRKSDVIELPTPSSKAGEQTELAPVTKKARVSEGVASSSSSGSKEKTSVAKPQTWQDIKLPGEDEEGIPVYPSQNQTLAEVTWLEDTDPLVLRVTHWLRDIGGINSNSFSRFMREKGKTDGASNGTYYAAYVYFEKMRILEGKKKTATRLNNENTHPGGFSLENRRYGYYFVGR